MLKLLVEQGRRVPNTDAAVKAAMGDAAGEPDRLEVVKYLVGLGAPINAHGMQFCHYEKCASVVLMMGKLTALHHAAKAGKRDMVEADKSLTTFAHQTAQDLAIENGHQDIVIMLQNWKDA